MGVGKFYIAEEALTLLRNMNDFEDESTSESEIEADSSKSSEYAPEQQYQVRTISNIQTLLAIETVNQNTTKHALLADKTATTSGEEHVTSPPKLSKVKEIPTKGKKDNAESNDTFINKAVLTVASYTRTVYYKYNRIPVFYHLPFAFLETN